MCLVRIDLEIDKFTMARIFTRRSRNPATGPYIFSETVFSVTKEHDRKTGRCTGKSSKEQRRLKRPKKKHTLKYNDE